MKKLSLYIFLVLMWCNVGVADSNALEKLDSELIRLGTNSVENNLECTSPEKAAKKDWSKIYYKFGVANINNTLFAYKWRDAFKKYEIMGATIEVEEINQEPFKSKSNWFFLGPSPVDGKKKIRMHVMAAFSDTSGEYYLHLSEMEISKEDAIILQKFDKERIENEPNTDSFDADKFASMTSKLTDMYAETFLKYGKDNMKKLLPLICRTK